MKSEEKIFQPLKWLNLYTLNDQLFYLTVKASMIYNSINSTLGNPRERRDIKLTVVYTSKHVLSFVDRITFISTQGVVWYLVGLTTSFFRIS